MSPTAGTRLVQRQLGLMLRSKVAGDDAPVRAQRIWGAEGERWFTPDDPVWRVHADASMFPAGITSLLLQMLHPMAMAGVAGHSGYKSDPWGRLQRTSHYLATTTFGTIEHAEEAIAMVRSIHERVRGKDHLGRPYRAGDPHLLRWVHVAEIDSFLRGYQTFGDEPLTDDEADVYVAQAGIPAARLGVIDPPTSVAELRAVLDAYRPELEATSAAREAAHGSSCSTRPCRSMPDPATAPSPPAACPCCPDGRARCSASRCPASCRPSWRARSGTSARQPCGGAWPGSPPAERRGSGTPAACRGLGARCQAPCESSEASCVTAQTSQTAVRGYIPPMRSSARGYIPGHRGPDPQPMDGAKNT